MSDTASALDMLRALLTQDVAPNPVEVERTFDRLEGHALQLIQQGERGDLDNLWRPLRRLYEVLAARGEDDYPTAPTFHLGRVVSVLGLVGAARDTTLSAEVVAASDSEDTLELLRALQAGSRLSKDLESTLGWDKATLSRRLKRLRDLDLVTSRKAGQSLMSDLTWLGEQALEEAERREIEAAERRPPGAQPAEYWKCSPFDADRFKKLA